AIEHGHQKAGKFYYVHLDTRWEGKDHSTTALGTDQKAWFKARIDDFAEDVSTHTMFVVGQGMFGQVNAIQSDDWWSQSAEVKELVDYIADTLAGTGKGVVYAGGDRHVMYCAHRAFQGAEGYRDNIAL